MEVTRDVTNSNSSCSLGQLYYMYALHLQQLKVIQSSTQMQHLSHLVEFPVTPAFGQRLQDNYSPEQLRVQRKGCKKIKKNIFRQTCEDFCSVILCNDVKDPYLP